jgi:hypothetical protein
MGGPEAIILVGVLVFLVAIPLVLGLVCRGIMLGKGRSGGAGFCLGFFLGLLGLVICLAQSDARPQMYVAYGAPGAGAPAPGTAWAVPAQQMAAAAMPVQRAPRDRAATRVTLQRVALGLTIASSVAAGLLVVFDVNWWGIYRAEWVVGFLAAAGVAAAIVGVVSQQSAATYLAAGCSAAIGVLVAKSSSDQLRYHALLLIALVAVVLLVFIAGRRDPASAGYPLAHLAVALAFAAISASPAFDADSGPGWFFAVAIVVLACIGRGRWAPLAPIVIGIALVAAYIDQLLNHWEDPSPLDLIAGAIMLLGGVFLLAASSRLPDRSRQVPPQRSTFSPPAPTVAGASFVGVSPGFPTPPTLGAPMSPGTSVSALARGDWDDATVQRSPTWAAAQALPPLPGPGAPSVPGGSVLERGSAHQFPLPAPTPSAAVPQMGAAPAVSNADRPAAPPWWIVLVAFGVLSAIAPFVPFTNEPYSVDFVDALPFFVVAVAAILAGVAAALGYVSAFAAAAGLTAMWGTLMIIVVWLVVDIVRFASEFDTSIDVGPGMVLFCISAVLGLIVLIPATVQALRSGARRAHQLLGLVVAGGTGLVVADLVRPHDGVTAFDSSTKYDVTVVALVVVLVLPALLALIVRTGAAHAMAFGALLLPAATVLQGALGNERQLDPLMAWGVAVAGTAAAIGVASASERMMRRGHATVARPAGGITGALVGLALALTPAVVATARRAGLDDGPSISSLSSGGSLSIGSTTSGYLESYGTATYDLIGNGANVSITVSGEGALDPQIQVVDPSGFTVGFNDNSGSSFDALLTVFLSAGTSYRVEVTGYQGSFGAFTIRVQ